MGRIRPDSGRPSRLGGSSRLMSGGLVGRVNGVNRLGRDMSVGKDRQLYSLKVGVGQVKANVGQVKANVGQVKVGVGQP